MFHSIRSIDNRESNKVPMNEEILNNVSHEINAKLDVLADKIDRGFQDLLDRLVNVLVENFQPMVDVIWLEGDHGHHESRTREMFDCASSSREMLNISLGPEGQERHMGYPEGVKIEINPPKQPHVEIPRGQTNHTRQHSGP